MLSGDLWREMPFSSWPVISPRDSSASKMGSPALWIDTETNSFTGIIVRESRLDPKGSSKWTEIGQGVNWKQGEENANQKPHLEIGSRQWFQG